MPEYRTVKVRAHMTTTWVGTDTEEDIEVQVDASLTGEALEEEIRRQVWDWALESAGLEVWFDNLEE